MQNKTYILDTNVYGELLMNKRTSILSPTTQVSNKFSSRSHKFGVFMNHSNKFQCFFHIRFSIFHTSNYGNNTYKTFEGVLNAKK